jgi:hypothetical protein
VIASGRVIGVEPLFSVILRSITVCRAKIGSARDQTGSDTKSITVAFASPLRLS